MTRRGGILVAIGAALVLLGAASAVAVARTLELRYERDVSRMVFNDNLRLLAELRRSVGLETDSLARAIASSPEPAGQPYLVVSIEDRRLWFRQGDSVLFTTEVATGSGRVLEHTGDDAHWRFETPRGRLIVISKETAPVWIAPDWHYIELAQRRGLGVIRLQRGESIDAGNGAQVTVVGSNVVVRYPDGRLEPVDVARRGELVVRGNVVIPPFGTVQRKYAGVLGTHRLNLGDGYALHGTNRPETIGRAVSHGCVRLRNEDIAALYEIIPVGTAVYIY